MALTGFGRKCAITIDHTKVGATLTDFPVLLTKDTLPSEMFDADGSNPALNGGGDIRFSSDADGNTQLACEVVAFVTDNDPANGSAEIWVKIPSLSSVTDTVIYTWYNKAGESQPIASDTYGSQNVWDTYYKTVLHLEEDGNNNANGYKDSTANAKHGTGYNLDSSVDEPVKIGKGQNFQAGDKIKWANGAIVLGSNSLTVSFWLDTKVNNTLVVPFSLVGSNNNNVVTIQKLDTNVIRFYARDGVGNTVVGTSTATLSGGTLYYINGVWDYSTKTAKIYINNALAGSQQNNSVGAITINALNGLCYQNDTGHSQRLDDVRVSVGIARTAERISTEYNNQNSPATFATEGTPESAGGGGGATWTPKIIIF